MTFRTAPRTLQPAPSPQAAPETPPVKKRDFYDLPAELRIQIYQLALENVTIHIIPLGNEQRYRPHALTQTSKQVRAEVLPLMQRQCRIESTVTDFNFSGVLDWVHRVTSAGDGETLLSRNNRLHIRLCFSKDPPRHLESLRKWLHDRADPCRVQPRWKYSGHPPNPKVTGDLRRRWRRMRESGKCEVLRKMVKCIGVDFERQGGPVGWNRNPSGYDSEDEMDVTQGAATT